MGWAARARTDRKVWFVFNRRIRGRKVHFMHGAYAWELQIGTRVIQKFYNPYHGQTWRVWADPFGLNYGRPEDAPLKVAR